MLSFVCVCVCVCAYVWSRRKVWPVAAEYMYECTRVYVCVCACHMISWVCVISVVINFFFFSSIIVKCKKIFFLCTSYIELSCMIWILFYTIHWWCFKANFLLQDNKVLFYMFCTAIKLAFFGRLYMFAPCSRMLAVILSHFFSSHYLFLSLASNCRSVPDDVFHSLSASFFRQTFKTSHCDYTPHVHVCQYTEKATILFVEVQYDALTNSITCVLRWELLINVFIYWNVSSLCSFAVMGLDTF